MAPVGARRTLADVPLNLSFGGTNGNKCQFFYWFQSKLDSISQQFQELGTESIFGLGLATQPDDLQQQEEQGHHVQIEVEGSEHVLLGRNLIFPVLPTQDELRVKYQILQRQKRDA